MKHLYLVICWMVIGCMIATNSYAQNQNEELKNRGTGALLDEAKYAQVPLLTPFATRGQTTATPPIYSLKRYCPTPGNQYNTATCVGWAAAYGVQTMLEGIQNGWDNTKNPTLVNSRAYSPSFIYNQVVPHENNGYDYCNIGAYVFDALEFMQDVGSVRLTEFPFDDNCARIPNDLLQRKASKHRIQEYMKLTFSKEDNAKVNRVRTSLAKNIPVIVAMKILRNFKYGEHENGLWNPQKGDTRSAGAHALVVIGYDDTRQAFEVMNSWGVEWGNEGFLHISYQDFNRYAKELYTIVYNAEKTPTQPEQPEVLALAPSMPEATLGANIKFSQLSTEYNDNNINCLPEMVGSMQASHTGSLYKMNNAYTAWTGYQIFVSPKVQNMYVYIFGFDSYGYAQLLFPYTQDLLSLHGGTGHQQEKVAAIIPYESGIVAIPHEEYCMQLDDKEGTLNCFLFANQKLDIQTILQDLQATQGTLATRLGIVLGERIPPDENIIYDNQGIGFQAKVTDENAVIPILVDMNHVTNNK